MAEPGQEKSCVSSMKSEPIDFNEFTHGILEDCLFKSNLDSALTYIEIKSEEYKNMLKESFIRYNNTQKTALNSTGGSNGRGSQKLNSQDISMITPKASINPSLSVTIKSKTALKNVANFYTDDNTKLITSSDNLGGYCPDSDTTSNYRPAVSMSSDSLLDTSSTIQKIDKINLMVTALSQDEIKDRAKIAIKMSDNLHDMMKNDTFVVTLVEPMKKYDDDDKIALIGFIENLMKLM